MTPQEAKEAQAAGAAVLDLRTPKRFAEQHLAGAINLQFNRADLVDRAEMVLPMDLPLVIHGEPEAIAKMAAKLLEEGGFKVLGHLEGGLKGRCQTRTVRRSSTSRTEEDHCRCWGTRATARWWSS